MEGYWNDGSKKEDEYGKLEGWWNTGSWNIAQEKIPKKPYSLLQLCCTLSVGVPPATHDKPNKTVAYPCACTCTWMCAFLLDTLVASVDTGKPTVHDTRICWRSPCPLNKSITFERQIKLDARAYAPYFWIHFMRLFHNVTLTALFLNLAFRWKWKLGKNSRNLFHNVTLFAMTQPAKRIRQLPISENGMLPLANTTHAVDFQPSNTNLSSSKHSCLTSHLWWGSRFLSPGFGIIGWWFETLFVEKSLSFLPVQCDSVNPDG